MFNSILKPIFNYLPESNRFERIWKLAQVDFKKRFYNDKLGIVWALLNPMFRVVVYWVVFTYIFEKVADGIDNYALFLFSGIIVWMAFTETSKKAMRVLTSKKYLIENIQLNKIDLFLSTGLSSLIGFLFNLCALIIVSLLFGSTYSSYIIFLPILILTLLLLSLGFGMILSIVYIYFKDINHLLDIVFLIGFWSSGIFFRGQKFLDLFPPFLYINPFVGLIMNVRSIMIYNEPPDFKLMSINLTIGLVLYVIGVRLVQNKSHDAIEKR